MFKLYKPGQGYWTRMLSGIGGGVMVLGGAAWLIEKLSVIQNNNVRVYAQGGEFLAVVMAVGLLVWRAVGSSPRSADFLIATEGEMKKVNWPARKEVTGSTWVVVWCVILLTLLLYVSDVVFFWLFRSIGILE
jgi:preprotein translocase subunit SecE